MSATAFDSENCTVTLLCKMPAMYVQ